MAPQIAQLVYSHVGTPAIALTPALDIVAANAVVHELYSQFSVLDNLAWMTFLDAVATSFHPDWDHHANAAMRRWTCVAGPCQQFLVYQAEPGSASAARLNRLARNASHCVARRA